MQTTPVNSTVTLCIIGPYFFHEEEGWTVNAECYMDMLEIFLKNELNPLHFNSAWFQED
jgi:hypothetical protein